MPKNKKRNAPHRGGGGGGGSGAATSAATAGEGRPRAGSRLPGGMGGSGLGRGGTCSSGFALDARGCMERGASKLQFPSCSGCRARAMWAGTRDPRWATGPGAGRSGTLGRRDSQNEGDQDLALFLEAAACCPVLCGTRDGAERRWLAAVAGRLCLSPQHGVSRECQTSGGFGPALASRGLGCAWRGRGDAEARVASIPLPPCACLVSTKARWRRRKRRPPPHPKRGTHP